MKRFCSGDVLLDLGDERGGRLEAALLADALEELEAHTLAIEVEVGIGVEQECFDSDRGFITVKRRTHADVGDRGEGLPIALQSSEIAEFCGLRQNRRCFARRCAFGRRWISHGLTQIVTDLPISSVILFY